MYMHTLMQTDRHKYMQRNSYAGRQAEHIHVHVQTRAHTYVHLHIDMHALANVYQLRR